MKKYICALYNAGVKINSDSVIKKHITGTIFVVASPVITPPFLIAAALDSYCLGKSLKRVLREFLAQNAPRTPYEIKYVTVRAYNTKNDKPVWVSSEKIVCEKDCAKKMCKVKRGQTNIECQKVLADIEYNCAEIFKLNCSDLEPLIELEFACRLEKNNLLIDIACTPKGK